MSGCTITTTGLWLGFLVAAHLCACDCVAEAGESPRDVVIMLTDVTVVAGAVDVRYRISNYSSEDIWLCQDLARAWASHERYFSEDNQTLVVRRRLTVPQEVEHVIPPEGTYVRLSAGKSRSESLVLPLRPKPSRPVLASAASKSSGEDIIPSRLTIEIGFCTGDLYRILLQRYYQGYVADRQRIPKRFALRDLQTFVGLNEGFQGGYERVVVQWPVPLEEEEGVLQLTVEWPHVPADAISIRGDFRLPELTDCSHIVARYVPSMLECFYPEGGQQSLLSSSEREHLERLRQAVITDYNDIRRLGTRLSLADRYEAFASVDRAAHIVFHSDGRETGLTIYADEVAELESKQRLAYPFHSPGLRGIVTQIQPIELRLQCANNLEDLWHRLRLWNVLRKGAAPRGPLEEQVKYPETSQWCDATAGLFGATGETRAWPETSLYACPGASDGRSHYAMNPHCTATSPGDMVLLFETNAGWNQHGGPELFTFDHHDPRGGCVLLNDGTVKFIRTEEELHALRWK